MDRPPVLFDITPVRYRSELQGEADQRGLNLQWNLFFIVSTEEEV